MNTVRTTAAVAALSLLLAACASTPETAKAPAASASRVTVERDYVDSINRANQDAGITVHWINPPRSIRRDD